MMMLTKYRIGADGYIERLLHLTLLSNYIGSSTIMLNYDEEYRSISIYQRSISSNNRGREREREKLEKEKEKFKEKEK